MWKLLVKGAHDLYYLKDESAKEHFYYQLEDETPQELINRKIKRKINGKAVLVESAIYRNTLTSIFSDCTDVLNKILAVSYTKNSLQKIFTTYNNCLTNVAPEYVAPLEKFKFVFGALAGPSTINLDFEGFEGKEGLDQAEFKGNTYMAGLSLDIIIPRLKGKWSIYNELVYKPYKLTGEHEMQSNSVNWNYKYSFDTEYVGVGTMVRYRFLDNKFMPFVNIGIANNFALNIKTLRIISREYNGFENTKTELAFEDPRMHEFAVLAGAGLKYKNFGVEARYERGDGMNRISATTTKTLYSFLLSYSFN